MCFLFGLFTVPPDKPIILDRYGQPLNESVGPHAEGDNVMLSCRVIGGKYTICQGGTILISVLVYGEQNICIRMQTQKMAYFQSKFEDWAGEQERKCRDWMEILKSLVDVISSNSRLREVNVCVYKGLEM